MYLTATVRHEVLEDLRNRKQYASGHVEDYRTRLKEAMSHCGNVHSEDGNITLYVYRLSDTIRMVFALLPGSVHRTALRFESIVHVGKSEDDSYRARVRHLTKSRVLAQSSTAASRPMHRPHI